MPRKNLVTQALAVLGTTFAVLPLLAPLVFSGARQIQRGIFRFDYLMPAELFPLALVGGALLVWAAARAHADRRLIAGALAAAALLLVGTQAFAVVTGVASGAAEMAGWRLAVMVSGLVLFTASHLALVAGGVLLLRSLYGRVRQRA